MINLKLIAISATVALTIGFGGGLKTGLWWQQGTIDDLKSDHQAQLQAIEDEAERDLKEREDQINHLQKEFAIADTNYQETVKNAQIEINKRDADILALRSVQRVKIKPVVCRAEGKDSNSSAPNETSYAELDPETSVRAFGVTDDGDKAIKQLNELQNRVRQLALICPIEII